MALVTWVPSDPSIQFKDQLFSCGAVCIHFGVPHQQISSQIYQFTERDNSKTVNIKENINTETI